MPLLPCHPRDLLGMAVDRSTYLGRGRLDKETLRWAWDNYFLHQDEGEFGITDPIRE